MKTYRGVEILNGGEWSVSRPDHLIPGERDPGTHWIGGDPEMGRTLWRRENLAPAGDQTPAFQPIVHHYTDWNMCMPTPYTWRDWGKSQMMSVKMWPVSEAGFETLSSRIRSRNAAHSPVIFGVMDEHESNSILFAVAAIVCRCSNYYRVTLSRFLSWN
jgi:hypothetical protein